MFKIPCVYSGYCGNHGNHSTGCKYCKITTQYIPANKAVTNFEGSLPQNQTNASMTCVIFDDCSIPKVPVGLAVHFSNMSLLVLQKCQLQEISKDDFRGMEKLGRLKLSHNNLEYLPGDLFTYTKNLQYIYFDNNKIKYIDSELLDLLTAYVYEADFRNNVNINIYYYSSYSDGFNQFKEKFKAACIKLKSTEYQKIVDENAKVLEDNCKLKAANEKLEKDITDDINEMLKNEDTKDFTIKIGAEEFKVHKFLFIARSPTFAEMMRNNPEVDKMELKDISEMTFKEILKFIYTDKEPSNDANIEEIFGAASKLKIKKLKELTAKKLIDILNLKNSYELLVLGHKNDHEELKQKAFEKIKEIIPKLKDEMMNEPEKLRAIFNAWRELEEERE